MFPSIFWDHFLWKYFWGPIVADAESVYTIYYNGVETTAGYNWINTATYALLTILALYIAYKYLRNRKESEFKKFFFSLIPLIIYGSIARVLEDADLFVSLPLRAFFISPLIYIQIFLLFIAVILTAVLLEKMKIKIWAPFLL
jgi:Predicted membrane protein